MAFTIPTREQIAAAFLSDYAGAQPNKNVSRGSDPYRLSRVVSGAVWTLLGKVDFLVKAILPDTLVDYLQDRWGAVYQFPRLQPTPSAGVNVLEVTGTIGNAVTQGAELAHADGTTYQVTSVGAVVGGSGSVTVSVAAISTGSATNKGIGETLTFTNPPDDIDADATLTGKLIGGTDLETPDAYSVRLQAHIGDPPEGGAIHDYVEWAKRQAGVSEAYVWAHRRGAGTMDVAVLGTGTGAGRIPPDDVLTAVDDYIESVRPGNVRDFLVLTTTPVTQDVTLTLEIDETAYKWDWDDAGTGYIITAHDSTAKTITVPTAPAAVIAGVRIQVRGEEARVTNRTGDVLTLSFDNDHDDVPVTWFTFSVTDSTDTIRASGDLVRPVRFAIMDLFNTLGPARSQWSETTWIDQLKISKLVAAITDVPGADDADITVPSGNASPTSDTFGSSVAFLVPGNIQVLKPA